MKFIQDFFNMQRERYRILLRRRGQLPCPDGVAKAGSGPGFKWTTDPVLAQWRFCNVFREDDRTTVWFRENIREPLRNSPAVFMATVAFRWFNRIETGEKLKPMLLSGQWDSVEAKKLLWLQEPVVTGAYMIKTPPGMDKLNGVCWCIDQVAKDAAHLTGRCDPDNVSLQGMWEVLRTYPYFGPFMAYEVVSDLRHTWMGEKADDILTWANAGPGCTRGMGRVVSGDPKQYNADSARDQQIMLEGMRHILACSRDPEAWPAEWPQWEMREVEHGLCEYDKYKRGQAGEKLKRRYQ